MLSTSASLSSEYPAVLNRTLTGLASTPPASDTTPDRPAGIRSVYRVDARRGLSGMNIRVRPVGCQCPATCGESVGYAELPATGAENMTRIVLFPLSPDVPGGGAIDATCIGPGGPVTRRVLTWDLAGLWWPEPEPRAVTASPAVPA